jgi:hypothetical protein
LALLSSAALSVGLSAQKAVEPGHQLVAANAAFAAKARAQNPAWLQFQAEHGGEWLTQWRPATGTPSAIFGPGLPIADWRENTIGEARRHAGQLLRDQAAVLGLGTSEFREVIGSRVGRQWSFVYDQYFRGLPVIGGRADVRVSMAGRIAMFGSSAWPIPAEFDTTPAIGSEVAVAAAWQALGQNPTGVAQPAADRAPKLVVWGDIDATEQAPFFLAWEVPVSNVDHDGNGPIGRYYVDARTAAVLRFHSDKHECGFVGCTYGKPAATDVVGPKAPLAAPVNTTVTVMGWTRMGLDANDPPTNVPLPGVELNVPGVGIMTTDQNGQFTVNIAAPVSISYGLLDGRHHAAMLGTDAPSGSVNVTPGVPATIQLFTPAVTINQASHTTTSLWTDRVNEYCRGILGNSPELGVADAIVPRVNMTSTCNAYYTANTINFYNAGGGCTNTATPTIIAHEWGHGLDDRYGGISQTNGLSEGWGDLLAMYLVDDPRVGSGFQTPNVGLRNGNNTQQYPTGSGVHAQGQSWMGFAWKLRDRLATTLGTRAAAIALTNDIVVGTIAADAVDQQAAVLEVFLADDNDGNVNNGTPNYADLVWACQQHSLPYPGLQVPTNDECSGAITVGNGLNGPFSSLLATTSAPAWSCASGGGDVWFRYYVGASGALTVTTCGQSAFDTAISIYSGTCGALTNLGCNDDACSLQSSLTVPVSPGIVYIRVGGFQAATGAFSLDVTGPQGAPASAEPFGTGCYRTSSAFYEQFTAAAFDLGNSNMQLVKTPSGYLAQPGGTYVAPSPAATQLTLGDDAITTVNLASQLAYPGGTTTSLVICSNGFVSPAIGNGTDFSPTVAEWLNSAQARWGTWHDFNPNAGGSGKVKFEEIGNVSYVTWDGVYSYNTTAANTWQLQFDRATGNVTFVWTTMVASGSVWLVGFAAQAPNSDLGNRDISATLPGTFRTGANAEALALASTLPQLGTTFTLTATNYPPSSGLGVQVLSLASFDPGIDLTSVGMPGCFRYTGLDAVNIVLPIGGQSVYSMAIPNDNGLQGLPLNSQTWAFSPGANALGVISSNGVRAIVGQ